MARTGRTLWQSIVSPVLSTSLYFVVFGAAIGSRITQIEGVAYGAFIVPGLIMLTLLTQSTMNASFGIYFPRFTGTIYEILSAPVSSFEIVLGYVGAAATKSIILGLIILATSFLFVPLHIAHPFWMLAFLVLTAATFSLLGFIIGIWADGFEKLQIVPLLIITPLTFLGGTFYSISVLPPLWQKITLFNPVVYLISGFRWSFFEIADVSPAHQPRHDAGVPGRLPCHGLVDFQDRLPAEELTLLTFACARIKRARLGYVQVRGRSIPETIQGGYLMSPISKGFASFAVAAALSSPAGAQVLTQKNVSVAMAQTIANAALAQVPEHGLQGLGDGARSRRPRGRHAARRRRRPAHAGRQRPQGLYGARL